MARAGTRHPDFADHSLSGATDRFMAHLAASGCSPNTIRAYRSDLRHLAAFLAAESVDWREMTPECATKLLLHLRSLRSGRRGRCRLPHAGCQG